MSDIRYINQALCPKGWLEGRVGHDPAAERVSYPSLLKVRLVREDDSRFYFVVMEGPLQGDKGSIKKLEGGAPTLIETASRLDEGHVFVDFYRSTADSSDMISGRVWLGSRPASEEEAKLRPKIVLKTYKDNPPPLDWSEIEIPDFPHTVNQDYLAYSLHASVWFRISYSGDKYLHCGRFSAGCATVDVKSWEIVYLYLYARRRTKDTRGVGAINVKIHD